MIMAQRMQWNVTAWVVLVFVTAVFGRPLYLLAAEPNECMVWSVDPNLVPYIGQVDVNEVWGRLLPPGPDDVNDWELACGKYQRPPARACDPEGDPISISCLGGTSPATVYYDPNAGAWYFTAEVLPGVNLWRFAAMDASLYAEPKTSYWWVTCWGVPPQNTAPVLR